MRLPNPNAANGSDLDELSVRNPKKSEGRRSRKDQESKRSTYLWNPLSINEVQSRVIVNNQNQNLGGELVSFRFYWYAKPMFIREEAN